MSRPHRCENVYAPLVGSEERMEESRWLSKRRYVARSARQFVDDNTGLLLVLASQAVFPMIGVAIKCLNAIDPPVSVFQVIFVRMVITYVCSVAYMHWNGMNDLFFGPKSVWLLLMLRAVSGLLDLSGGYFSLQHLSLPDATVLTFLSPLTTALAGALLLKEIFRRSHALASIVCLVGVVLIARPPLLFGGGGSTASNADGIATERMIAVGAGLIGVLGITSGAICIRAVGERAHPSQVLASYSMYCGLFTGLGMIAMKIPFIIPRRLDQLALLLVIGFFGLIGQCLYTMGLQRETAGRAMMATYTQIIFATIFERIFFHTYPSTLSILGASLILLSALYIALTKERENQSGNYQRLDVVPQSS